MSDKDLRPSASYLWLETDGQVLLHRRKNTGYMDGMYQLPAGHVDPGEVPSEAMIREAMEELGIVISQEDIEMVMTVSRIGSDQSYYDFFFKATVWQGFPQIKEPEKCDDLQWFKLDELPENIIPYNRDIISLVNKGVRYAEEGYQLSSQ